MRTGTNHFKSLDAAISYYSVYGYDRSDVLEKWRKLEIQIGKPKLKDGDKLLISNEGQYFIESI